MCGSCLSNITDKIQNIKSNKKTKKKIKLPPIKAMLKMTKKRKN